MAEIDTTATGLSETASGVAISKDRQRIILESAYEIEKLSDLLRVTAAKDEEQLFYAIRGITIRLKQLSGIVMSAIGDDSESDAELGYNLRRDGMHPDAVVV